MRIIVDAMGGDNAPESAVWGGALAAKEYGEEVLLVGKPEVVANVLKEKGLSEVKGITIMPANDLVDMHDDPATVLRHKPDSSMDYGMRCRARKIYMKCGQLVSTLCRKNRWDSGFSHNAKLLCCVKEENASGVLSL